MRRGAGSQSQEDGGQSLEGAGVRSGHGTDGPSMADTWHLRWKAGTHNTTGTTGPTSQGKNRNDSFSLQNESASRPLREWLCLASRPS